MQETYFRVAFLLAPVLNTAAKTVIHSLRHFFWLKIISHIVFLLAKIVADALVQLSAGPTRRANNVKRNNIGSFSL